MSPNHSRSADSSRAGSVTSDSVAVRRPQRWDQPMDPLISAADVEWLLSKPPFCQLDPNAFPRTISLEGVLQNDCKLHRTIAGQVIIREGDYANSAFLVLEGSAKLITRPLSPEQLGRSEVPQVTWGDALWQFFRPSDFREARRPEQVAPPANWGRSAKRTEGDPKAAPLLWLQDFDGIVRAGQSVTLGPGELFGEVAAMVRSPHAATVVADHDAVLLEIRWQGLKMLRRDRGFADRMESHYRTHWLPIHLREIPLFRYVPEAHLRRVVEATQMKSFGRMEWNADYKRTRTLPVEQQIQSEPVVAPEGSHVTDLIVVRSGFGRMCRAYGTGQRTVAYLGKGHLFGLEETAQSVLGNGRDQTVALKHSLLAVGFLDTLHIPVEVFASEILPFVRRSELPIAPSESAVPQPRQRRRSSRESVASSDVAAEDLPIVTPPTAAPVWEDLPSPTGTQFQPTGLLEFIVQNRFNNGQQAMVIDLHRCTRCDDCVKACAAVHDGNPRFARIGNSHERLQFVQACMHCSDPVCMIGCPTGAIHRDESTGTVRISEPICIGCGVCAASCPYENIDMVTIRNRKGQDYVDLETGKPITKATKCDLCAGLPSGPACQSACPHDALVRIDLSQSPPLQDWLRRRS